MIMKFLKSVKPLSKKENNLCNNGFSTPSLPRKCSCGIYITDLVGSVDARGVCCICGFASLQTQHCHLQTYYDFQNVSSFVRIRPWLTRIVYVHLIYKHSVLTQLRNDLCRRVAWCCGCTFGHLAECAE